MEDWKMRGKESSPEKTVARIEGILKEYGFETEMQDVPQSLPDCYSCRLTIKGDAGPAIGTNGKGMTRELCYASAYGEMMERVENRIFSSLVRLDDREYTEFLVPQYPLYKVRGGQDHRCVAALKKRVADTISNVPLLTTAEDLVDDLLEKLAPAALNGQFGTLPFYSLTDKEVVYLPDWMQIFIGSNGLAAGNTLQEAMVEGISELVERYSQLELLNGTMIPPVIPDEVIDRYPHIRKIITSIEADGGHKVRVLDASLGKGIPTVCGVVIDTKTGNFGVKFGAQPNMGIALERVFTESMQGSSLERFSNSSRPGFFVNDGQTRMDKWNSIKISSSSMPATLLMDEPSYPFREWPSAEHKTNQELMMDMLHLLKNLGADIYVRDASYMGFPAVNIYAAGISEVRPVDFLELKINRLILDVQDHFLHLGDLTQEQVRDIAILATAKRGAVLENTIGAISGLYFREEMPGAPFEADLLLAACLYRLGKTAKAVEILQQIMRGLVGLPEKMAFIKASFYYLNVRINGTEQQAFDVVRSMLPKEAEHVRRIWIDPQTVLTKLYPDCGGKSSADVTEGGSTYQGVREFYKKLVKAEADHPMDQMALQELFQDFTA